MLLSLATSLMLVSTSLAHDAYPGSCPTFTPMQGFDWDQFSQGVWYVTQKFSTKSSCLTYQFQTDQNGFKSIKQVRELPLVDKTGLEHEYIYEGKLYAPQESIPAKMVVQFPLNVIGPSSYVIMDTDYNTYGLLCTCQDRSSFGITLSRRSCSILQRSPEEDTDITNKMKAVVDSDVEDGSHDFEKITQTGCNFGKDKVFSIDVDKILNSGGKGISDTVKEAVDTITSEFDGSVLVKGDAERL